MNNRGDLTITLLVIGVFAICSLALLSFIYSNIEVNNSFVGLDLMDKMNTDIEKYSFSRVSELKNPPVPGTDVLGNFFYEEKKTTTGYLWWQKEKILFFVKYYY